MMVAILCDLCSFAVVEPGRMECAAGAYRRRVCLAMAMWWRCVISTLCLPAANSVNDCRTGVMASVCVANVHVLGDLVTLDTLLHPFQLLDAFFVGHFCLQPSNASQSILSSFLESSEDVVMS